MDVNIRKIVQKLNANNEEDGMRKNQIQAGEFLSNPLLAVFAFKGCIYGCKRW